MQLLTEGHFQPTIHTATYRRICLLIRIPLQKEFLFNYLDKKLNK